MSQIIELITITSFNFKFKIRKLILTGQHLDQTPDQVNSGKPNHRLSGTSNRTPIINYESIPTITNLKRT